MKMRNIFVLMLTLAMVFVLCACGAVENEEAAPTTTAPTVTAPTEGETEPTEDNKITYTAKVVDQNGAPVVGAMIQLCLETCVPTTTDANGVATWKKDTEEAYKVSFINIPEGYSVETNEFHFEAGSTEMTIVLKAA